MAVVCTAGDLRRTKEENGMSGSWRIALQMAWGKEGL